MAEGNAVARRERELPQSFWEYPSTEEFAGSLDRSKIPARRPDVKRLFEWRVAKALYRPDLRFEEMNHVHYDWNAPVNAARQTLEHTRSWCGESGLDTDREVIEEAGITATACKAQ